MVRALLVLSLGFCNDSFGIEHYPIELTHGELKFEHLFARLSELGFKKDDISHHSVPNLAD